MIGGGGGGTGGPAGAAAGALPADPCRPLHRDDLGFRSLEFGHLLRLAELKEIALAAIEFDVLHLGQEFQVERGIDGQRIDLIFLAFGAQRGMKLVAARAAGAARLTRGAVACELRHGPGTGVAGRQRPPRRRVPAP